MWYGELKWRLMAYLFKDGRRLYILMELLLFTLADPGLGNWKDGRLKLWGTATKYPYKGMNSYFP